MCPVCGGEIKGRVYEEDGRVLMEKTCASDGTVKDLLSSDAGLFLDRMSLLDHAHPNRCSARKCKDGIFKCKDHVGRKSPLAFIEVTTRCNMRCPVCYADAEGKGRDIPIKDIERIIDTIADEDPKTHVILIGGEPTIHRDFFRILEILRDKGLMKRAFIATNGITLADKAFSKKVHDAGIKKFYLGFDGTDREACKKIRGSYAAYDGVRKALVNIRENGKAWIIISITAVRDLNIEDIPRTIDFAMDNSDIVKRIMISPEVYCGRITEKSDLDKTRVTGDCVEMYLRDTLKVKVATVSISFFFALLKPLKAMGILAGDSWMAAMPSPFCGQMGLLWKDAAGRYHSIADLLVRDADRNIYELGRRSNRLGDELAAAADELGRNAAGKAAFFLATLFYFGPRYVGMLFSSLNWSGLFRVLKSFAAVGFSVKRFKKAFFKKKTELFYLLGSDRFNFIWDKMPYCLTHHYRLHPDTAEVIKVPGCFVIPFREDLEEKGML